MNVGFLFTTLSEGGIGRVTSIVMNGLVERSDFKIFGYRYAPSLKPDLYTLNGNIIIQYLLEEHVAMHNALIKKGLVRKLNRKLKEDEIDVLVACGDLHYPAALLAAIFTNTKVICWDHTGPRVSSDVRFQRLSKKIFLQFSKYNLLLTRSALDFYNKHYFNRQNFQIYNPIDPKLERSEPSYNIASHKIISVGRLIYQKNFERLLEIAKNVLPDYPDWSWDIYGDGPEKEQLLRKCYDEGLDQQVHFKGTVANLYDLYPEYAMIVMTSRYEGFPMTLLEAASNGMPMIAFDVETGPNEIIINGMNGFLIESTCDEEMIRSIRRLLNNDALRFRMAKKSYETSLTFRQEEVLKQWFIMLDKVKSKR